MRGEHFCAQEERDGAFLFPEIRAMVGDGGEVDGKESGSGNDEVCVVDC